MEQEPENTISFGHAYSRVVKKSFAALAFVSFLVAVYFVFRAPLFGSSTFLVFMLSTAIFGVLPATTLGAGIYAYHLVTPTFGLRMVFLISALPGLLFVLVVQPELNCILWLSVGPVFALFLHLVVRMDVEGPEA